MTDPADSAPTGPGTPERDPRGDAFELSGAPTPAKLPSPSEASPPTPPLPRPSSPSPAAPAAPATPASGKKAPAPAEPAGDGVASPPPERLTEPFLAGPARFLARKGAGPWVLASVAVILAVLATFTLMVHHPGLAGLLGLLAVLAGELARVRVPGETAADTSTPDPGASAIVLLADLTLGASFVIAAAADDVGIRVILGLAVVALLAWLPFIKALAGPARIPTVAGLWRRPDRLGVLMLGPLLGHPVIAQLMVLTVGALDAWTRLARLAPEGPGRQGPTFLAPLVDDRGALQPLVRWGSLALAFLLLLVLPRPDGWRF